MFLRSQCCCDEGEASQCVFLDEFAEEDLRYEEENTGAGTGSIFENTGGEVVADGSGSYTLRLHPNPPRYIEAATLTRDTTGGTGKSGVTIRKAGTGENVALVRDWSTANGYELSLGGTVLATFTASGPAEIRLRLVKDGSGGWDAEAYVGGVLQHTEVGIAFSKAAELNVGLIAEGGGEFEYLKVSPCPLDGFCPQVEICGNLTIPAYWEISIPESSGMFCQIDTDDPECSESIDRCSYWDGRFYILPNTKVAFYHDGSWTDQDDNVRVWAPQNCNNWSSVFIDRGGRQGQDLGVICSTLNPFIENAIPDRYWPIHVTPYLLQEEPADNDCPVLFDKPYSIPAEGSSFFPGERPTWQLEIVSDGADHVKLLLIGFGVAHNNPDGSTDLEFERYESPSIPEGGDISDDPIELTRVTGTGELAQPCSVPSSITIHPNGETSNLAPYVNGCAPLCEPPLNPFGTLISTGTIGGIDYCGFLDATFNEETFSWEFQGTMQMSELDACNNDAFGLRIECLEREEGQGKKWYAIIDGGVGSGSTGGETFIELDVTDGDNFETEFLGQADIGCGDENIIGFTQQVNLDNCISSHPFGDCCPNTELLCCSTNSLRSEGTITCEIPGTGECSGTREGMSLTEAEICGGTHGIPDFNEADGYFRGALPFDVELGGDFDLIVWCQNGTAGAAVLDNANNSCPLLTFEDGDGNMTLTCDESTFEIIIENAYPQSNTCCDPGGDSSFDVRVTFGT